VDSPITQLNKFPREQAESALTFAGFLVFHCPLKADAIQSLKMLADSSHRVSDPVFSCQMLSELITQCIMITGDNPLTAVHVARTVEIVDREALILDLKEGSKNDSGNSSAFSFRRPQN
jgi:cation-transporting ATPase 13A1